MSKAGRVILVGSIIAAGFLLVVWFIGFLGGFGGNLIHLLLVLALAIGVIGSVIGIVVMIVGKKPTHP
ncbi:MAG TPA: DUF5670 family protein [Pyrinomonadaceae bacterium]|nr:DUF5670 family protein [Pyrinomonadaceae bacterium]